MLPLGTSMPSFSLLDTVSGKFISSKSLENQRAVLIAFICNHCPFVHHIRGAFKALVDQYSPQGLVTLAISSNDISTHPQDAPEKMKEEAARYYAFPYLYDAKQEVAQAFRATCTPDFFLFDKLGALAYRGCLDNTRPESGAQAHGKHLALAIAAVLQGQKPSEDQKPSMGCNIKWRAGHAPDYFKR